MTGVHLEVCFGLVGDVILGLRTGRTITVDLAVDGDGVTML